MLISKKSIPGEGISCWQGNKQRDDGVDSYVGQRINIAHKPCGICENRNVIFDRKIIWPECKRTKDFIGCLEGHVDEPVDWHHQEYNINCGN